MTSRTVTDLVGLAVVALTGGERLGRLRDVVFHASTGRLTGFLVDVGGLLSKPKFLPTDQVQSLGADALTIANADAFAEASPSATDPEELESRTLSGRPVLNVGGTVLGKISDTLVDASSLTIAGFLLSTGLIDNTLRGKPQLPISLVQTVGKDSVVVPDAYDPRASEHNVAAK